MFCLIELSKLKNNKKLEEIVLVGGLGKGNYVIMWVKKNMFWFYVDLFSF